MAHHRLDLRVLADMGRIAGAEDALPAGHFMGHVAHEAVAHAVKHAIGQGVDLSALPLATLQGVHASIGDDVFDVLTLRGSLNARSVLGGTAPVQVRAQIARHRARLG